jgi:hypothetical protein
MVMRSRIDMCAFTESVDDKSASWNAFANCNKKLSRLQMCQRLVLACPFSENRIHKSKD